MFIVLTDWWTGYDTLVNVYDITHVDAHLTHEQYPGTKQFIPNGSEICLDKSRSNGGCLTVKEPVKEVLKKITEVIK